MKQILVCDVGSTREKTREGFLKVRIRATRTGVMRYKVNDIEGVEDLHGTGYVYIARKPEDVFNTDSLSSLRDCSITDDHPVERQVNADNYKSETVGHVNGSAEHDDNNVYVPSIIKDAATIQAIEKGKEQVSVGADAQVVPESGVMNGQKYDYAFKNIVYNHISVVERGRAGNAKILDEDSEVDKDKEIKRLTSVNDQLSAENKQLKSRVDMIERDSVINDAKRIDSSFEVKPGQSAKDIKLSLINDEAITDSSPAELIDYAFKSLKKSSASAAPVVILSSETTNAGKVNDAVEDDSPATTYNNWEN